METEVTELSHNGNLSGVQSIRLWKIDNNSLQELSRTKLDLEDKLEEWIAQDVSLISSNIMLIGRQVATQGGSIDLLGMEENGDLVIIELKRDKTPRDITAQVLDYASSVKNFTADQIENLANKYLGGIGFEATYQKKFGNNLPESINEHHKMYIIGSEIDSSSQRIIKYLSDEGLDINALTFNYFKDKCGEFISRVFLIEPMTQKLKQGTRLQVLSQDQLQSIADDKGVGEIYSYLVKKLADLFDSTGTTRSSFAFSGRQEGKMNTIFSLVPEKSTEEGLKFQIYASRCSRYFGITEIELASLLPQNKKDWKYYKNAPEEYSGFEGFFKDLTMAEEFVRKLQALKKSRREH
jgi:Holliday junction resolvase-like predicted endonuclease